jgi:hypothetical protein
MMSNKETYLSQKEADFSSIKQKMPESDKSREELSHHRQNYFEKKYMNKYL